MKLRSRSLARSIASVCLLGVASWGQESRTDTPLYPPLPLGAGSGVWVENQGQWPAVVRYVAQTPGRILRLECGAIGVQTYATQGTTGSYARIVFDDSGQAATPVGIAPTSATYAYYLGNDPTNWHPAVRGFSRVGYASIAKGLDLVLQVENGQVLYDWAHTSTGNQSSTDPEVRLEGHGIQLGAVISRAPLSAAWALLLGPQLTASTIPAQVRQPAASRNLGAWNLPPPSLLWSTYLGGAESQGHGDYAEASAWNDQGELAVAGLADRLGFPLTPGTFQAPTGDFRLVFLTKFRGRDGALTYSALLGGTAAIGGTQVRDLTLDPVGRATVVGLTLWNDFPTTAGAFDPVKNDVWNDAGFAFQLTPGGESLTYSTYLESENGGARIDAIAHHPAGGVVLAGGAGPGTFPTTPGAYQNTFRGLTADSFVGRLNAAGSAFDWLTLLGGTRWQGARDIALTPDGRPVVLSWTGSGDFPVTAGAYQTTLGVWAVQGRATAVTVFTRDGSTLDWSTFVAGNSPGQSDEPSDLDVDGSGSVFVAGNTDSPTFPVTPGAFQTAFPPPDGSGTPTGFVFKLDPTGSALLYSTLITGTVGGVAGSIHVDPSGVATLGGAGYNSFPTTPGAFNPAPFALHNPSFLRLSPAGDRLFYFSHVGGPYSDAGSPATNSRGRVAIAGYTVGGYPTTPNAVQPNFAGGQTDAFVTVLDLVFRGVQQFGESTASCRGVLQMNTTAMPSDGLQGFSLWCSGAPPSTRGLLLFGTPRSAPAFVAGAQVWIDLSQPTMRMPVATDAHGFVETVIPIPAGAAGRHAAAQYVFRNTTICGTGVGACSSNALRIEVQ